MLISSWQLLCFVHVGRHLIWNMFPFFCPQKCINNVLMEGHDKHYQYYTRSFVRIFWETCDKVSLKLPNCPYVILTLKIKTASWKCESLIKTNIDVILTVVLLCSCWYHLDSCYALFMLVAIWSEICVICSDFLRNLW
jgi:hypothetical protein